MKTFFSVDIETDGVVAGRNNMLSLGCAAIDMETGKIVGKFKRNIETVSDLHPDLDTMQWWKQFPEAYKKARENAISPKAAIKVFAEFVEHFAGPDSVMFAWNPVMDLAFVRYYLHRFHPDGVRLVLEGFGKRGFGLDQKTAAAIALGQTYKATKMGNLPRSLRIDETGELLENHSHDALEDATEQAYIFYNTVQRLGGEL